MRLRWLPLVLLCAWPLPGQKYTGPMPEKTDLVYLVHADNLVPAESASAKEEERKSDVVYVVPGSHSTARTPLASPIFLIRTDQLQAGHLQLYKLESKAGQREIVFSHKKKMVAHPIRMNVNRVEENLYRLEVDELLENGEYSLTPEGSNQVFCFQIY